MTRYAGRRTFSNPPTKQEVEELVNDMARALLQATEARVWTMLPSVRASSAAAFDHALPVNTAASNTIDVSLPLADSAQGGRELALIRQSALGVVRVMPPNRVTIDGAAGTLTLPTTVGLYVFMFDGVNYWRVM